MWKYVLRTNDQWMGNVARGYKKCKNALSYECMRLSVLRLQTRTAYLLCKYVCVYIYTISNYIILCYIIYIIYVYISQTNSHEETVVCMHICMYIEHIKRIHIKQSLICKQTCLCMCVCVCVFQKHLPLGLPAQKSQT